MKDKKVNILSNLKRQVLQLKSQLDNIQKKKIDKVSRKSLNKNQFSSLSKTNRFDRHSFQFWHLDKGTKKFTQTQNNFKNISQLIEQKSQLPKTPQLSNRRKIDYLRTKQNFSTQHSQPQVHRIKTPNPLTGEGYTEKRKGLKLIDPPKKNEINILSSKKHFYFYK